MGGGGGGGERECAVGGKRGHLHCGEMRGTIER